MEEFDDDDFIDTQPDSKRIKLDADEVVVQPQDTDVKLFFKPIFLQDPWEELKFGVGKIIYLRYLSIFKAYRIIILRSRF